MNSNLIFIQFTENKVTIQIKISQCNVLYETVTTITQL